MEAFFSPPVIAAARAEVDQAMAGGSSDGITVRSVVLHGMCGATGTPPAVATGEPPPAPVAEA